MKNISEEKCSTDELSKKKELYSEQLINSVVSIEYKLDEDNKVFTGFFIKIPDYKNETNFNFLIINENIISEKTNEEKITIEVSFRKINNEEKRLIDLDENERYIKYDNKYNYTIIQIIDGDKIMEDQYLIPDLNYKDGYEFYINKSCDLVRYKKSDEKQVSLSQCAISKIKEDHKFEYYLETQNDSLDSPLICLCDNLVIGINIQYNMENNTNYGTFIGVIIDDINIEENLNKIYIIQEKIENDKNELIFEHLIKKEYKIIEKIGRGANGTVYKLEKDNKYYAFRKIPIFNLTKEEIDKYSEEYKIISELNSEYIVKYYYSFIEKDYFNIIMEYAGNMNLKQYIKNHKNKGNLIEEKTIKDIITQICLGLKAIHKNNLIHGNLTPNNIIIDDSNKIKICDLGLPKRLYYQNQYNLYHSNRLHYIAPEIELGLKYDYKTDIYSLGCILYELFTLKEYYTEKNISENDYKIDLSKYNSKWQELIDLLLNKDYHNRPTIEEVYIKYIKENKIIISTEIENNYIGKKIYFFDCVLFCLKEMNELNTEIYINDIKYEYKKYFIPKKEGIYTIQIIFNFPLENCSYMFSECHKLKSIDLSSFEAKNVNNMKAMFYNCNTLENIDLSSLNTQNVTDMSFMFYKCEKLKNIDLSSFNTQNLTDMSNMFDHCLNLESINLFFCKNKNVKNMNYMFSNCKYLKNLDLSSFSDDFSQTSMKGIFFNCDNLAQIKANNNFVNKLIKDNPDYKFKKFYKRIKIIDN